MHWGEIDIHACEASSPATTPQTPEGPRDEASKTLLSSLRKALYWPKNGLSNLIAFKLKKNFLGEHAARADFPSCSVFTHTLQTDHFKSDG